LRANWGKALEFGDLHFTDLLTFERIAAVSPPYSSLSLNADLIWHFDDQNPAHYDLFNVRYVVAPRELALPSFLRRLQVRGRYSLSAVETSGYARFATILEPQPVAAPAMLLLRNRTWLLSAQPALGRFPRYAYPPGRGVAAAGALPGCPGGGTVRELAVRPGRLDLEVACPEAAGLVLKLTYHPNWRVTLDGRPVTPFMVAPSFLGLGVPAGRHTLRAEYRAPRAKTLLALLGAGTCLAALAGRRRLARLEARLGAGR
jgi:hypothetical protein